MKPAKPADVATLIGTSPAHQAVIRSVGWGKVPCKDALDRLKESLAALGQPALDAAARELLDYERHGETLYAFIKPALHVHCRMLIGPMPREWATWWQNADGSDRKGKPADWPPKLPGPPEPTKEESELRGLSIPELAERLHTARLSWIRRGPATKVSRRAWTEVQTILAEYQRRGYVAPQDQARTRLSDDELRRALRDERQRYNASSTNSREGREASQEIDMLYAEFKRRGLAIPALDSGEGTKRKPSRRKAHPPATSPAKPVARRKGAA